MDELQACLEFKLWSLALCWTLPRTSLSLFPFCHCTGSAACTHTTKSTSKE